ncbi:predicted protein [Naegleria gruberi]|uniref:Predicted protein n=1 Tax=Naegleria gruberi TaxID=5762 RepID=D2V423_NAEGR|nr:uncharacterized protein NAEGRDRAFT_63569 [Naegleria gruberi]EFC48302.1 predicted protein [Naegleria gruberi]|eukprot:XP_002681046.1 predicted protein [Naegleria gruberi strain NEG-M]
MSLDEKNSTLYVSEFLKGQVKKISFQCSYGYKIDSYFNCEPFCENECKHDGICIAPNKCDCYSKYDGDYCQYPICYGIPSNINSTCSKNGECQDFNKCQCYDGYFGDDCTGILCFGKNTTDATVCSGHGKCIAKNQCSCTDDMFGGLECQYPKCRGIESDKKEVCSSHGKCEAPNTCSCFENYVGEDCQFISCFGKYSNDSNVCFGNGNCSSPDFCACRKGYTGTECEYTTCFWKVSNDSSVCSGHGKCVKPDTCECSNHDQFTGIQCEIPICYGVPANNNSVCSSQGTCIDVESCQCNLGYHGPMCNVIECFNQYSNQSSACSGHGQCILPNLCQCHENSFTGLECELPVCNNITQTDPRVCSANGECKAINDTTICDCRNGYAGTDCEFPTCLGIPSSDVDRVCGGKGDCLAPNLCKCKDGLYDGLYCEFPTCSGKSMRNNTACSGLNQGICESLNNCVCKHGYTGNECQIPICFSELSSSPLVCSGRGTCTSADRCKCKNGYSGKNCEVPHCFGISANLSRVCNWRNGTCVDKDRCECNLGYHGNNCQVPTCNGILSTEPSCCGGPLRGQCLAHNSCSCAHGKYGGPNCEFSYCFGILSSEANVCKGTGTCIYHDKCECHLGYAGSDCGVPLEAVYIASSIGGVIVLALLVILLVVCSLYLRKVIKAKQNLKRMENLVDDREMYTSLVETSFHSTSSKDLFLNPSDFQPIQGQYRAMEGGQGKVYVANYIGIKVALKKFHNNVPNDDMDELSNGISEDIEKEMRMLNGLRHPSIVTFYGYTLYNGSPSMVMGYVPHALNSIIYKIRRGQKMSLDLKIQIIYNVSQGLEHCHTRSPPVIHRDIKSANILLDVKSEEENIISEVTEVKICDFGLSTKADRAETKVIGTPHYMAPELFTLRNMYTDLFVNDDEDEDEITDGSFDDSVDYDTSSDVYSLAIVMWELFFELPPYDMSVYDQCHPSLFRKIAKHRKMSAQASKDLLSRGILLSKANFRPFIPFDDSNTQDWLLNYRTFDVKLFGIDQLETLTKQFINLMKECWKTDPYQRPQSSKLKEQLQKMLNKK